MKRIFILFAAVFVSTPIGAQTVYRCVDENGASTIATRRINSSCKAVPREPINTIPARGVSSTEGKKVYSSTKGTNKTTDPSFPKVSVADQKARDNDRRYILGQELESEERALKEAQAAFRAQPQKTAEQKKAAIPFAQKVAQHQRNIENIQKELEKFGN